MGLFVWVQWHVGPIGMLQTFQAIGKGYKTTEQRISWGTGTAIGRMFGQGHWGITLEVLSAIVQFGTHQVHAEGGMRTRARLTTAEAVLLGESYHTIGAGWTLFSQFGGVMNIPYQLEYFAHRYGGREEAFVFIHERRFWEIHPQSTRIDDLTHHPYPAMEVGILNRHRSGKALIPTLDAFLGSSHGV